MGNIKRNVVVPKSMNPLWGLKRIPDGANYAFGGSSQKHESSLGIETTPQDFPQTKMVDVPKSMNPLWGLKPFLI